jgi:hypothetical protein
MLRYRRQTLVLQGPPAGVAASAAGRHEQAGRPRWRSAPRKLTELAQPPADRARRRTRPPGARPARRTRLAADLGQARRGAHPLAPGWRPGARGARAAGPPGEHAGQRDRAEAPHHRGPAPLVAGPPRPGGDAGDPGARVWRALRRGRALRWHPVALAPPAELMVYRLVQEAVNNISKHAQATQVWLSLAPQGRLGRGLGARRRHRLRHPHALDASPRPGGHALSGRSRARHAERGVRARARHADPGAAAFGRLKSAPSYSALGGQQPVVFLLHHRIALAGARSSPGRSSTVMWPRA